MSNKLSIPAWQHKTSDGPPASPASPSQHAPKPEQQPEHSSAATDGSSENPHSEEKLESDSQDTQLLDRATQFLDDPAIHDAPRERKAAFLESKGVESREIEALLGADIQADNGSDLEEAGEWAWSTVPPRPLQQPAPRLQPREIPPIVTYPEFLAQSEKPPPLITTSRLVNTAYTAGGLMATIYGLSKFILAPMAQDLVEARQDFVTHTREHLDELNKKLGEAVSVDPATKPKPNLSDIADDVSEADSDPTELYHRDYGTQTSPNLSRRPSVAASADPEPIVTGHETRLKIITSHLKELEANRSNNNSSADLLQGKITDLTSYLTEMSYQNQYYSSTGGMYGSSFGLPSGADGKKDQMENVKQDIRAVKGVFLSARNFPTGGPSTPSAMPTGRRSPPMPTGRVGA